MTPVRPLRGWPVLAALLVGWLATVLAMRGAVGWRADVLAGDPAAIVVERAIILLVALAPLLVGVMRLARPGGRAALLLTGALAWLALLPALALASVQVRGELAMAAPELAGTGRCVGLAVGCALPTLIILVIWARRWGAVTEPGRASVAIGLVAAVSGVAIYSLTCPSQHWLFTGSAYSLAMASIVLLARLALPRLLRW
ncbi:NrsF family protein [Novosphingobium piscinae]|uniref:NrsF family protein n=1 Tax=Novosphingobium piscinae TaxID=1507448 RepID=UPI002483589F|nr:NrsF family protein [Novosphingobium piscinae]